jgi:hypothetical protein
MLNAPVRPFSAYADYTSIGIVVDPIIANNYHFQILKLFVNQALLKVLKETKMAS